MARVFEKTVATPRPFREGGHQTFDNPRTGVVERVRGLTGLKKNVRVLRRASEHGPVGCQGPLSMGLNRCFGNEAAKIIIAQFLNFDYLM